MRIGFRSFKPPILANVSSMFALFSTSRHLKPCEASNGFIWNHLRPKNTSLFLVSCRENDVFLCGFDACGPPIGGFGCLKASYFTNLLSFCISPATMIEKRRDLRCFLERYFHVLLFLAFIWAECLVYNRTFGRLVAASSLSLFFASRNRRMYPVKSHLWPLFLAFL